MIYDTCALKPENETARLALLNELDLLGGRRFAELDRLTALAADICNADLSVITIYDAENGVRVSVSSGDLPTGPVPRIETVCTHIIADRQRAPIFIRDARADPVFSRNRFVHEPPYLRSYVGVTVGAERDKPAGVICVTHTEPDAFDDEDLTRLERVAELVDAFLATRLAQNRAERAVRRTHGERQRQQLFEMIFKAIQEGVNVHGPGGEVVEANPACLSILGVTADEMAGRAYTDPRWKTIRPDGSGFPVNEYPVDITLRTGRPTNDVPMGVQLPSGDIRWISINTVPLLNPGTKEVDYAVVTMKDITRQREAEDLLNKKNAELAEALIEARKGNQAKTDFMGVMSHELRTPMNAVLSCAALLSQSSLDPVQRRTLGVLQDAGRQMLALLNDLLDLSSLNADKVRISREPVSLVRLIEDAAVIWASEVRAKDLSLSVMIDPALVAPREVDPARLLQVIGNLMANAIKFTSAGGITIQAWPEKGRGGVQRIAIEVEDTGPGVPDEAAARIFSAFEQADVSSTRKHGGLGLGLHVARRLARAMGGDIELETRLDQGSRFTVRIEAPVSAAALGGGGDAHGGDASALTVKNVLCVDDNPRNLYVLGEILRAAGHSSIEVASGKEALKLLEHQKFDVVLLDMVMPDMDGVDMLARLRKSGGVNRATPVIACTANVLPDQVEAYRKAGTAAVIAKPINIREILEAIASAE